MGAEVDLVNEPVDGLWVFPAIFEMAIRGEHPMPNYVLNNNAQPNSGDHEVHIDNGTCAYMPLPQNRIALGSHTNCSSAVATAKARYPSARINGCYWCSNPCHTS